MNRVQQKKFFLIPIMIIQSVFWPQIFTLSLDHKIESSSMNDDELCYMSANEALANFQSRSLSPVELTKAIIHRAEAIQEIINPFADQYFDEALDAAKVAGADGADAMLARGQSTNISLRLGHVEASERSEDFDIGLRVFIGQRTASISTSQLDSENITNLAERAVAMAKLLIIPWLLVSWFLVANQKNRSRPVQTDWSRLNIQGRCCFTKISLNCTKVKTSIGF